MIIPCDPLHYCIFQWTLLIVAIVSFFVYVIFLFVLIKHRQTTEEFRSSFFKIWIALSVADLYILLHTHVFTKAAYWGWFREEVFLRYSSGFLPSYSAFGMRTASLAQFNGVLLLALNRYTAIVLPTRHQNIWSKRVLVCAIFAQWIVPIAIITPYFWVGIVHSPIDNSTAVAVRFAYIHIHRFYYIVGTVYMGVICFSCTVLYAHMLYSQSVDTRHRTLSVASNTGGRTKRGSAQHLQPLMQARTLGIERYAARKQLELKLALSGFAVFLVALSYTIMMAYTSTSQNYHTVFILWTFSSDILSYANVYILFIVSPIVRQRFAQTVCGFFRRRKGNRSNLSSPRSSATARTLIFTKQTNLNVDDDFV